MKRALCLLSLVTAASLQSAAAHAALAPTLTYHNGHVMNTPKVFVLFWGSYTSAQKTAVTNYVTGFTQYISNLGSPAGQEPTIRQYGVFSATFAGSYHDTSTPNAVTRTDVANKIASLQPAHIPAYDPQLLVVVAARTGTCTGLAPGDFHDSAGPGKYFGMVQYPGSDACTSPVTAETMFETLISHEIQEAATDPDIVTGWHSNANECGQPCEVNDASGSGFPASCNNPTNYMVTFPNGVTGGVAYTVDNVSHECKYFVPKQQSDAFAFRPLEDLNASMIGSPGVAISSWGAGSLYTWITGSDHVVYYKSCADDCYGNWTAWSNIGGTVFSKPAVVSWGPNRIDVFGLDSTGVVVHRAYDSGTWSGWDNALGGAGNVDIAVDSQRPGNLTVFAQRSDGSVQYRDYNNGTWSGWLNVPNSTGKLGSTAASWLSVTSWGDGRIDLQGFKPSLGSLQHDTVLPSGFTPWDTIANTASHCGSEGAVITARVTGRLISMCSKASLFNLRTISYTDGVGWSAGGERLPSGNPPFRVRAATSWNGARTDVLIFDSVGGGLKHTTTP